MAKTATQSTRSPHSFVPGNVIRASDVRAVHEAQNEARCNAVVNLLYVMAAASGWTSGASVSPAGEGGITWPATGTVERYRGWVYIDADLQQLAIASACVMTSGTGSVVITIGSTSTTHAHTGTGAASSTLAVSATGTGWQLVTIDLQQDSGDPSSAVLQHVRVRSTPITVGNLPDPSAS